MSLTAIVYKSRDNLKQKIKSPFNIDEKTGEPLINDILDNYEFHDVLIELGNVSAIGDLREYLKKILHKDSIIMCKILYSGSHAGDYLSNEDILKLRLELESLEQKNLNNDAKEFISKLNRLTEFSLNNNNPIVFI